ncbi:hypothetical protein E1288_35710 [Saccharopolyspora elongata]|uniref:Uncharacterized protein n=1 Tax=Saccharopolyspora elongata TaxID=2530387 RepID=A0A4R4Y988_9PSEU|nr:hypothetical protein E1288_35710 [Saccharopolyspora elongata]
MTAIAVVAAEMTLTLALVLYGEIAALFVVPFLAVAVTHGIVLVESRTYAIGRDWIRRGFRAVGLDDLRSADVVRGSVVLRDGRGYVRFPVSVLRAELEFWDPIDAALCRSEDTEVSKAVCDLLDELAEAAA